MWRSTQVGNRGLQIIVAMAVLAGFAAQPGSRAEAAWTPLCESTGYACTPNIGYNGQSTWGSGYGGGHNCVSLVAYVLSKAGVAKPSWWSFPTAAQLDNAGAGKVTMNGTASVGAIAQWEANVSPARADGHIAIVTKVTSTYIEVREDNWYSSTRHVRITSGTGWPSRFVHLDDAKVRT